MARVLLFGRLSDVAGWRERQVDSPFLSVLRQRLGDTAREPRYIRTLRNEGYVFVSAVASFESVS